MSEQDAYIREAQKELRRIVVEGQSQWMRERFAAGHKDYIDKVAMRQVKIVLERAAGASWLDVAQAIRNVARRPADRPGYVYALDDEIGRVAQERSSRERSQALGATRLRNRIAEDALAARDLAELQAKYPGVPLRKALELAGLDPFHRPA
jgi:hypothetical protein